jgi:hypothetical protein
MVDEINIVANVRRPQYFSQWKGTSIIWKMEDELKKGETFNAKQVERLY